MSAEFWSAGIAAGGSVVVAALTYALTKARERDADLRREKLVYYKAFVESFSGALKSESSDAGMKAYSHACNNLVLFAPQGVVEAIQRFEIARSTSGSNLSNERHDELLSKILLEIRKDLNVSPRDNPGKFRVSLWAPRMTANQQNKPVNEAGGP